VKLVGEYVMRIISVIIATHNRCESLKDTLDSLLVQEAIASFDYEILVIDNNSKDKTKETVELYIHKFGGKLRYLLETKQGKSFALNLAIKEARGEIIAFTDDDAVADKNWLVNIGKCYLEYNFNVIGGKVLPLYPGNAPKWIIDNKYLLSGPVPIHDYGNNTKIYDVKTMFPFLGANMAIKKDCFNRYSLFRTDLGPGTKMRGEDTELFKRFIKNGEIIYYCGEALIWHKVDAKRANYKYIAKWQFSLGRYYVKTGQAKTKYKLAFIFGIPRYLFKIAAKDFVLLILNIGNRTKFLITLMRLSENIGSMYEWRFLNKYSKS
jgi:glucosyl-dolichyl phosphate glucuronosyltransferase